MRDTLQHAGGVRDAIDALALPARSLVRPAGIGHPACAGKHQRRRRRSPPAALLYSSPSSIARAATPRHRGD